MSDVILVEQQGNLYGVLLRYRLQPALETRFVTGSDAELQLGIITRKANSNIAPHRHADIKRTISGTKECIIVQKGKIAVDFYSNTNTIIESLEMNAGDALLLLYGGHGIRFLEDSQLLEVKQGPFVLSEKTLLYGHQTE